MANLLEKIRHRGVSGAEDNDSDNSKSETSHAWPAFGTHAWLRLSCCNSAHPTRIEDFDDDDVVIGGPIPLHHAAVAPPSPRTTFILGWSNDGGNFEQPVRLIKHEENPLLLWTVAKDGEGTQTQRRAYFRVEANIDVELHLLQTGPVAEGRAVDISEGGMRCSIPEFTLNPGNRTFRLTFLLDKQRHECDAHIVRWGSVREDHRREIGIEFHHQSRALQDTIRAFVFRRQLEMRKNEAGA